MRTFNIAAAEIIGTPTGEGFRSCSLKVTIDESGKVVDVLPWNIGVVQGAPNPESEGGVG